MATKTLALASYIRPNISESIHLELSFDNGNKTDLFIRNCPDITNKYLYDNIMKGRAGNVRDVKTGQKYRATKTRVRRVD